MGRTPDEIKKGLSLYTPEEVKAILQQKWTIHLQEKLYRSAFVYIQQLEAQNAELSGKIGQLEAERDALLKYLTESHFVPCDICKHDVNGSVMGCKRVREIKGPCFEWRGVQKEG